MDEKDKDGPKTGCGSQVAPIHTEQKLTFDGQLLCHLAFVTIPAREVSAVSISLVVEFGQEENPCWVSSP